MSHPAATTDKPASGILIKKGEWFAFLGASITEQGWNNANGYIRLVAAALARNGAEITPILAGVSGDTSRDMLARLDRDVIGKKPDWVAIDAGRNDLWHGSVPFEEYKRNMTTIVTRLQEAGVHVVLQTITPIGEDLNNDFNQELASPNQFLRSLAEEKHCLLADLSGLTIVVLKAKTGEDNLLTTDGVHMNDRGNRVMAMGLLQTLGLPDAQIAIALVAEAATRGDR